MLPNTNGFSFVLSLNEAVDKFLTASDVCCGVNPCFRVITGAFLHKRENWKNIFFVPPDPEYSSSASRLQSVTPFIWNIAFYFEKSEWWETQAISPLAPFERNGNMVHYGRLLCLRHLFPYILYIYIYIYIKKNMWHFTKYTKWRVLLNIIKPSVIITAQRVYETNAYLIKSDNKAPNETAVCAELLLTSARSEDLSSARAFYPVLWQIFKSV